MDVRLISSVPQYYIWTMTHNNAFAAATYIDGSVEIWDRECIENQAVFTLLEHMEVANPSLKLTAPLMKFAAEVWPG